MFLPFAKIFRPLPPTMETHKYLLRRPPKSLCPKPFTHCNISINVLLCGSPCSPFQLFAVTESTGVRSCHREGRQSSLCLRWRQLCYISVFFYRLSELQRIFLSFFFFFKSVFHPLGKRVQSQVLLLLLLLLLLNYRLLLTQKEMRFSFPSFLLLTTTSKNGL